MLVLSEPRAIPKKDLTVTVYCTTCWKDRPITTNGKCHHCGNKLPRPAHWSLTLKKLKLISEHDEFTGVEIKGEMYFLPIDYIYKFKSINPNDFKQVGEFIKDLKENCEHIRVT